MLIKVRAFPQAGENRVIEKTKDSFDVFVKAKPVKGLANIAIKQVLADYFKISESKLRLVRGFKQGTKVFEIK
jgi:uncharacterized protein YggU (UPF0235/DUF167 family)